MDNQLIQLIILFAVIIDPLASLAVFFASTQGMEKREKFRIALLSVALAAFIAYTFLEFGDRLLVWFSTDLDSFRVAGGIILGILGGKMALGMTVAKIDNMNKDSARAVASIIATPLLSGPACITAIMISVTDYGKMLTGTAVSVVLIATAMLFFIAIYTQKLVGKTAIQVISTIMGLITLAWGVAFVRAGLGF